MYEIRPLGQGDYPAITEIAAMAFPVLGLATREDKEKFVQRLIDGDASGEPSVLMGVFDQGKMVGGMRYDRYTMRLLSKDLPLAGIGFVVVDFLNKKRGVAKAILTHFLESHAAQGIPMVALYPFRPDFYKKMGFGYGAPMSQYRVRPVDLPDSPLRRNAVYLGEDDIPEMLDTYHRLREATNGLFEKTPASLKRYFTNEKLIKVGCRAGGKLTGYLVFEFIPVDPNTEAGFDLTIKEWVYEDTAALHALSGFLHSQKDQVQRVIIHTQDPYFHHLLEDPRNHHDNMFFPFYHESYLNGIGIMYRVVDVPELFRQLGGHDFCGETFTLGLTLEDTFYPANDGRWVIRFDQGKATVTEGGADVEVAMDIASFSSLITCSVSLRALVRLGRASLDAPTWLHRLDKVFATAELPLCMNRF